MGDIEIHLQDDVLASLRSHLLPKGGLCEEAAFLCTHAVVEAKSLVLKVIDAVHVPPSGFASRSRFYLELADERRAAVIKRAHDLGAGLIECHSHPRQRRACFSWSDLHWFDDFVPHVRWRLPNRAYAALVFSPDSFDALAWDGETTEAVGLRCIRTGRKVLDPTRLTLSNWSDIYDRQPL